MLDSITCNIALASSSYFAYTETNFISPHIYKCAFIGHMQFVEYTVEAGFFVSEKREGALALIDLSDMLRYLSEPRVLAANTWWFKLISPPSIPYRLLWVLYTNTTEASYLNRHLTGWWLDVSYFAWELFCWVRIEEYEWWRKPTAVVSLVRWSNSTPRLICADLHRY